jgi:lantibiotic modifying enzyme
VGIGIAAADLLAREGGEGWQHVLRRAAEATAADGFGWNHTLCHGDFGAWELLERAWAAGLGPAGAHREALATQILTNLEEHGPVSGMARDAFSPGLLAGVGGVAYQLLRMHPDCDLPSVLLPDLPARPPADLGEIQPNMRNRT